LLKIKNHTKLIKFSLRFSERKPYKTNNVY